MIELTLNAKVWTWRFAIPGPDPSVPGTALEIWHPDGSVKDWVPVDGKTHLVVGLDEPTIARFEIYTPGGNLLIAWSGDRPIHPGDYVKVTP